MLQVNQTTLNNQLKQIIDHYGEHSQIDMAIEEMSELTKELCKYKRGNKNRKEIIEELADVFIVTTQLYLIFNIEAAEVDRVVEDKLHRVFGRINKDEQNVTKGI